MVIDMEPKTSNSSGTSESPKEMLPKEMKFPVPADGLIPFSIEITSETDMLSIDVSYTIIPSLTKYYKTDYFKI